HAEPGGPVCTSRRGRPYGPGLFVLKVSMNTLLPTVAAPSSTQPLDIEPWVWAVTIGVACLIFAFDVWWIARNPHRPTSKELWLSLIAYVGGAVVFGIGLWYVAGGRLAGEYFAAFTTEKS